MDGYQFIAALLQSVVSLAWPIAFVIAVWMFRRRLESLLPHLPVKHKDLEFSFRLDQAEKEAASTPPPEAIPGTGPTPEEKSKFDQIAELDPRAAILATRADVEEAVRSLAKSAGLLGPKIQSFLGFTRLLRNRGVINAQTSALLDDLRAIGNGAAHKADAVYTQEEAKRFRLLADNVINRLLLAQIRANEVPDPTTP
jgi:hypothetical protein